MLHTICGHYVDAAQLKRDWPDLDAFYYSIPCWVRKPSWSEWDAVLGLRARPAIEDFMKATEED
jgi:hypothetical protein